MFAVGGTEAVSLLEAIQLLKKNASVTLLGKGSVFNLKVINRHRFHIKTNTERTRK